MMVKICLSKGLYLVPVAEPKESREEADLLPEDIFKEKRHEIPAEPIKKDEKKRAPLKKKAQKSSGMNWTYTAAAVIVAIAILIIFLMMQRTEGPAEVATTQNEEVVTPEPPAVPDPEPEQEVTVEPEAVPQPDGDPFPFELQPHSVLAGESHWTIADTQMGDPFLWPVIYELNKEQYNNPDFIRAQENLTIPSDADPDQLTDLQLEQVALGYLSVYRWTAENRPENAKYFLWAVGVYSMDILYSVENEVDANDWEFALRR